jgi:uncharacterized protein (TIGR03086 family)
VTTALAGAVELLDRSLSYTRVVLSGVDGPDLARPTPCRGWSLADLLTHMEDALDAFAEAAGGEVRVPAPRGVPAAVPQVGRLQTKACALLGAWAGETPEGVNVAGHPVTSELLVATAALEVTVHGWDVGRSLGTGREVPDELALRLLDVAHRVVQPHDRTVRFATPLPVPPEAGPGERLLAFLGRR